MIDKNLLTFFNQLRGTIGYYNFYSNAIKLIFIKYLLTFSDQLDIKDIKSYKAISEFKRKYDEAKNGAFVIHKEDVAEMLGSVECLKKESNVHLASISDDLNFLYDPVAQRDILSSLDALILKNDRESVKEVCEYLIYSSYNDVSKTGSFITSKALRVICMSLLEVEHEDAYMDCYAGFSSSLAEVKGLGRYIGYEINSEAALVSTIICIMMGIPNFEIRNEDFLFAETDNKADKVLSDVLLGYKREYPDLSKKYATTTKDIDVLSFYKAYYSAKENGRIVLTVPGKFLFSTAKAFVELRERITKGGLRAVVSLPPLWHGASVGTNLIYIEKSYRGEIEFVSAAKTKFGNKRDSFELLNTGNVVSAIREQWINEGTENSVSVEEVLAQDSWVPERYVNTEKKNEYRSVSEIDEELTSLYEQLRQNL